MNINNKIEKYEFKYQNLKKNIYLQKIKYYKNLLNFKGGTNGQIGFHSQQQQRPNPFAFPQQQNQQQQPNPFAFPQQQNQQQQPNPFVFPQQQNQQQQPNPFAFPPTPTQPQMNDPLPSFLDFDDDDYSTQQPQPQQQNQQQQPQPQPQPQQQNQQQQPQPQPQPQQQNLKMNDPLPSFSDFDDDHSAQQQNNFTLPSTPPQPQTNDPLPSFSDFDDDHGTQQHDTQQRRQQFDLSQFIENLFKMETIDGYFDFGGQYSQQVSDDDRAFLNYQLNNQYGVVNIIKNYDKICIIDGLNMVHLYTQQGNRPDMLGYVQQILDDHSSSMSPQTKVMYIIITKPYEPRGQQRGQRNNNTILQNDMENALNRTFTRGNQGDIFLINGDKQYGAGDDLLFWIIAILISKYLDASEIKDKLRLISHDKQKIFDIDRNNNHKNLLKELRENPIDKIYLGGNITNSPDVYNVVHYIQNEIINSLCSGNKNNERGNHMEYYQYLSRLDGNDDRGDFLLYNLFRVNNIGPEDLKNMTLLRLKDMWNNTNNSQISNYNYDNCYYLFFIVYVKFLLLMSTSPERTFFTTQKLFWY
jgi:hypothetical protein